MGVNSNFRVRKGRVGRICKKKVRFEVELPKTSTRVESAKSKSGFERGAKGEAAKTKPSEK